MQYDENKLLFWIICNVLLLLSLINTNVYFTPQKKKKKECVCYKHILV